MKRVIPVKKETPCEDNPFPEDADEELPSDDERASDEEDEDDDDDDDDTEDLMPAVQTQTVVSAFAPLL